MNYLKFIALSLLGFCVLSCSKTEKIEFTLGLQSESLTNLTQSFDINLDNQDNKFTIITEAGCTFQFRKNRFLLDGNQVSGDIQINIVEIFDKGTMCITGKHTMAEESILISGGEFYVNATQDDNDLEYSFIYDVNIPSSLSGPYSTDMELFSGGGDFITSQDWVPLGQVSDERGIFFWDSTNYSVLYNELEWFNCDRYFNDPRPKTALNILVPPQFDATNSTVYLAIKGEPNSLGIANQGEYPIGLEVQLILLSEVDNKYFYQILSTTVAEDEEYKFELDLMKSATPDELKQIINDLD